MTARARSARAVGEHDAGSAVALDDDLAHRRIHVDPDAMRAGGLGHRLRDRTHAAEGMAPRALPAVHLTEYVVQQHIGGAGRVGAGQIPDHRIEPEHGLDGIGFEPVVEDFAGGLAQQPNRGPQRAGLPQPPADRGELAEALHGLAEFPGGRLGGASSTRLRSTPATRPISA